MTPKTPKTPKLQDSPFTEQVSTKIDQQYVIASNNATHKVDILESDHEIVREYFKEGHFFMWHGDHTDPDGLDCRATLTCDVCHFEDRCPAGGSQDTRDRITKQLVDIVPEQFL